MRTLTVVLALGTVTALWTSAQAASRHEPRTVVVHRMTRIPVVAREPDWIPDYNIVPRYRYRPEDDRVDTSPYARPVAPGDVEPGGFGIGQ